MRDLTQLFKEEAVKSEQSQLYHLITFENISEVGDVNIVDANEDVQFNSVTYIKFPVIFNGTEVTGTGEINKASIILANPDRMFNAYLKNIRGVRVIVKTVFDKFVDTGETPDIDACIEDEFIVDAYTVTESTINLNLESVCDYSARFPRRRFTNLCYWRFKDPETCGYSGTDLTCKKDIIDCKSKNNQARYGGFLGIPSQARRINF